MRGALHRAAEGTARQIGLPSYLPSRLNGDDARLGRHPFGHGRRGGVLAAEVRQL
jgi:hypothetical protein